MPESAPADRSVCLEKPKLHSQEERYLKTLAYVLRTIVLFFLLILAMLALVALLGTLYVKVINLIPNQTLRYLLSILWFGAMAALVMNLGKKGMRRILDKD